jgi:hypothetical protein
MIEGEDAVRWVNTLRLYYVSALKDDPRRLFDIIIENLQVIGEARERRLQVASTS